MRIIHSILLCFALSLTTSQTFADDSYYEDASLCGGLAGQLCSKSEWCDWPEDNVCGTQISDGTGECELKPETCTEEKKPVCGCDGNTYDNECKAQRDGGVDIAHVGACDSLK